MSPSWLDSGMPRPFSYAVSRAHSQDSSVRARTFAPSRTSAQSPGGTTAVVRESRPRTYTWISIVFLPGRHAPDSGRSEYVGCPSRSENWLPWTTSPLSLTQKVEWAEMRSTGRFAGVDSARRNLAYASLSCPASGSQIQDVSIGIEGVLWWMSRRCAPCVGLTFRPAGV